MSAKRMEICECMCSRVVHPCARLPQTPHKSLSLINAFGSHGAGPKAPPVWEPLPCFFTCIPA
jgi:hypothetical protein